jgi:hypothetical protein
VRRSQGVVTICELDNHGSVIRAQGRADLAAGAGQAVIVEDVIDGDREEGIVAAPARLEAVSVAGVV